MSEEHTPVFKFNTFNQTGSAHFFLLTCPLKLTLWFPHWLQLLLPQFPSGQAASSWQYESSQAPLPSLEVWLKFTRKP